MGEESHLMYTPLCMFRRLLGFFDQRVAAKNERFLVAALLGMTILGWVRPLRSATQRSKTALRNNRKRGVRARRGRRHLRAVHRAIERVALDGHAARLADQALEFGA